MTASPWPGIFQAAFRELPEMLNSLLVQVAAAARARFGGRITYASGEWEPVDWSPFDIVGVDLYRDRRNADNCRQLLRGYAAYHKPLAITEFGCSTYRGAADAGGLGFTIVDSDAEPPTITGHYARSEAEQVSYLRELMEIFNDEAVDSAFWFTFAGYELPHRSDPEQDLDLASFGIVKIHDHDPDQAAENDVITTSPFNWEPKKAYFALAEAYATTSSSSIRASRDRRPGAHTTGGYPRDHQTGAPRRQIRDRTRGNESS